MATYYGQANIPWHANRALITTVNVGAGVTKLTTNAFCGCTNLETVNLPKTAGCRCWAALCSRAAPV